MRSGRDTGLGCAMGRRLLQNKHRTLRPVKLVQIEIEIRASTQSHRGTETRTEKKHNGRVTDLRGQRQRALCGMVSTSWSGRASVVILQERRQRDLGHGSEIPRAAKPVYVQEENALERTRFQPAKYPLALAIAK